MAFASKDLSVLAYSNGFTLWHYATSDVASTVDAAGYFSAANAMLRVGDMILANTGLGGTMVSGIFLVNSNSGGVVDVSDLTQVGANDSR
ncbi:Tail fiber protein [Azospirillaceae bacterium]